MALRGKKVANKILKVKGKKDADQLRNMIETDILSGTIDKIVEYLQKHPSHALKVWHLLHTGQLDETTGTDDAELPRGNNKMCLLSKDQLCAF